MRWVLVVDDTVSGRVETLKDALPATMSKEMTLAVCSVTSIWTAFEGRIPRLIRRGMRTLLAKGIFTIIQALCATHATPARRHRVPGSVATVTNDKPIG